MAAMLQLQVHVPAQDLLCNGSNGPKAHGMSYKNVLSYNDTINVHIATLDEVKCFSKLQILSIVAILP